MQGITIIEHVSELAHPGWFTIAMCVALGVCIIVATATYFDSIKKNDMFFLTSVPWLKFVSWVAIVGCCIMLFISIINTKDDTVDYYIVEVDETASLVEFTETFNVLSQDGNCYHVTYKEEPNARETQKSSQ